MKVKEILFRFVVTDEAKPQWIDEAVGGPNNIWPDWMVSAELVEQRTRLATAEEREEMGWDEPDDEASA